MYSILYKLHRNDTEFNFWQQLENINKFIICAILKFALKAVYNKRDYKVVQTFIKLCV